MRKFLTLGLVFITAVLLLVACGSNSKEDVVKKTSKKWTAAKGYEVKAVMEIKTSGDSKKYDVNVWHTKPEFYRVAVSEEGQETSQMIIRNEEGVFVVTPSLKKTYKFQSDWPKQNSQGYLINALADDLAADKTAEMKETKNAYIFKAKTRNNHSKMLPTQQVYIDKKTLLPTKVIVLNEANEEQIRITFKKITLGVAKKASDYAIEDFTKTSDTKADNKDSKSDVTSAEGTDKGDGSKATTSEQKTTDDKSTDDKATDKQSTNEEGNAANSEETIATTADTDSDTNATATDATENAGADIDSEDFKTHYPVLKWDNVKLTDEESLQMDTGTRKILSFEGDKSFTIIQEKVTKADQLYIPVFSPGDPADLGFTIGAITDNSITWEADGVSFFIASNDLSKDELIQVASSMVNGEVK
ncbi:outer membrane lipoprotein carrier protein LolA [Rummeliibacillus sp. NPDC094406]|uniref:outer membrane lipoprotein carrier protein LolA n=1 Tax=Rummeliibacillus sp. NPDC094406 TaxID=3364511 RepID=UPI003816F3FA